MTSYRETQLQSFYERVAKQSEASWLLQVSPKDDKLAGKLRSQGNKFYFNGHYLNAIDEYNKSLCFAQLDGDQFQLSVSYANRADALFRMDLPMECLKSIELAEAAGYPDHLRDRLKLMAARCEEKIEASDHQERHKYRLKLTQPSHDKIPFMAKCLQLRQSEEYGRYVVTTQDLQVGDVVMIEQPFIVCLRPLMRYKRCAHCTAGDQRHALMPCGTCTNALYCSQECLKEAWLVYHRFECRISEHLNDLDEFTAMALRSLLVGVSVYGGLDEYQEYMATNATKEITAFDLDYTKEKRDRKLEFLVLHQMHFLDSQMSTEDRNYWMRRTAEVVHLLVQAKVFGGDISSPLTTFLLNTIYRYTITNILNCYETSVPQKHGKEFVTVSQHLTMAMLNHSCAPNVQRLHQGGQQVLMVVRPVARGAQLFDNYGMVYTGEGRKRRQEHLLNQYGFRCGCVACQENFPLARKLKWKKGVGSGTSLVDLVSHQGNATLEARLSRADKLKQFLQKNDGHYPCKQLQEADNELYEIYSLLVDEEVWEDKYRQFHQRKD